MVGDIPRCATRQVICGHIRSNGRDPQILFNPGADLGGQPRTGCDRHELGGSVVADARPRIGDEPVGGGNKVAGTKRAVERQTDGR